jgi:HEPN domain-containing protein
MELIDVVRNWVKKAENDLKIAKDELNTREPATDMVCFHAQQCCEKYLKAFLVLHKKYFRKTHNIAELIELCKEIDKDFDELYALKVEDLTPYATEVRYAEDFYFPTLEEAKKSVEIAEKVEDFVHRKLVERGVFLV